MENTIPDGAQFLVFKNNIYQKVTAFMEMPIEIEESSIVAVNMDEKTFTGEGRMGFVITNVTEKDATLKFLNCDISELTISFGKRELIAVRGDEIQIELLAVRVNSEAWDKWKIAF